MDDGTVFALCRQLSPVQANQHFIHPDVTAHEEGDADSSLKREAYASDHFTESG
jgi:hypothetical protein